MNSFREFSIELNQYPTFNLENSVRNHGLFMMAPNVWEPSTKCFCRPLRLADSTTSVNVAISQLPYQNCLLVKVHDMKHLSSSGKEAILMERMLRPSPEDEKNVQDFQNIHAEAKEKGFGRIFRSPSLFGDVMKCLLLCFCRFELVDYYDSKVGKLSELSSFKYSTVTGSLMGLNSNEHNAL